MSTERLLILRTVLFTFKVEVHSHPSNRKSPVLIITGPKMLFTAPSAVSGGPVKGSPLSHVGGRTSPENKQSCNSMPRAAVAPTFITDGEKMDTSRSSPESPGRLFY